MIIRYYETLRENMKVYLDFKSNKSNPISLLNSDKFLDLYIIQFRFISDSLKNILQILVDQMNLKYKSDINSRMAAFIIFIIGLILAYLVLWIPFVSKLNRDVSL